MEGPVDDTATGVLCSGALVHTSLFAMANIYIVWWKVYKSLRINSWSMCQFSCTKFQSCLHYVKIVKRWGTHAVDFGGYVHTFEAVVCISGWYSKNTVMLAAGRVWVLLQHWARPNPFCFPPHVFRETMAVCYWMRRGGRGGGGGGGERRRRKEKRNKTRKGNRSRGER